jgi:hypothetical protein
VARLAGIPEPVIRRSKKILAQIEAGMHPTAPKIKRPMKAKEKRGTCSIGLFSPLERKLVEALQMLDVSRMTPIEALNTLNELADQGTIRCVLTCLIVKMHFSNNKSFFTGALRLVALTLTINAVFVWSAWALTPKQQFYRLRTPTLHLRRIHAIRNTVTAGWPVSKNTKRCIGLIHPVHGPQPDSIDRAGYIWSCTSAPTCLLTGRKPLTRFGG